MQLERFLEKRDGPNASDRTYIAIDLKSFYASVECRDRGRDPLTTHLVVADASRTEKTICLAVSPALKAHGVPGRPRLFEVDQRVAEVNRARAAALGRRSKTAEGGTISAPSGRGSERPPSSGLPSSQKLMKGDSPIPLPWQFAYSKADAFAMDDDAGLPTTLRFPGADRGTDDFTGVAADSAAIKDASNALGFLVAPPRMHRYMDVSTQIYQIYLRFVAHEDIFAYSVDEVFIDATSYLHFYHNDPHEMTMHMLRAVLAETGITATAGIGTNLYLAKIAMDIVAKHMQPDADGVRVAALDELTYRRYLWCHKPLTDFWRIGPGYARKLAAHGLFTMGDVARCAVEDEDLLYRLFGINAELLIDHSFGWEPATIPQIKTVEPENQSLSTGQVLSRPYAHEEGQLIVREMADSLSLMLADKHLVTDQIVLNVGYDIANLAEGSPSYTGEITTDWYGRKIPKHAHGSFNLDGFTSSSRELIEAVVAIYERVCDPKLSIRRCVVAANHVIRVEDKKAEPVYHQMDLFEAAADAGEAKEEHRDRERQLQEAMVALRKRYGKNAVLKGMNLEEGGTMMERNAQIGGHKA